MASIIKIKEKVLKRNYEKNKQLNETPALCTCLLFIFDYFEIQLQHEKMKFEMKSRFLLYKIDITILLVNFVFLTADD